MIRLGSLAGYPFEGPRVLGGWTPPAVPAVWAVLYRPDPDRENFAVLDVGQAEDLSTAGFPFRHPHAPCWTSRAGSRWAVHVCWYVVPGGRMAHRELIVEELVALYRPGCAERQFDRTWRAEWIGSYEAPTTGPLTTGSRPDGDQTGTASEDDS